MEHKYQIGDNVHFLYFNKYKVEINLFCLDSKNLEPFSTFHRCGKVIGIHITKELITYDIQTYSFNWTPSDVISSIPEYLISKDEKEIKKEFNKIIKNTLQGVKEYYENN